MERPRHILGIRVGPGHAFLELKGEKGPMAGQSIRKGFCPAKKNHFSGRGRVRDDSTTPWHYRICYTITNVQWALVANGVAAKMANPPGYNLITYNCTDWITDKACLAGIVLPNKINLLNIADPNTLWNSLDAIGDGGTFGGGTVTVNANPDGTSPCEDLGFEEAQGWGHLDPAGLATEMGLPLHSFTLGTISARDDQPLFVDVSGAAVTQALISIDWGDGQPKQAQQLSFSHVYPLGSYPASVLVVDQGAVNHYAMTVNVTTQGTVLPVAIGVPYTPPATDDNSGCVDGEVVPSYGDMDCDGATDVHDIFPFALALCDPAGYAAAFPTCEIGLADLNGDGSADGADIQSFLTVLLASCGG